MLLSREATAQNRCEKNSNCLFCFRTQVQADFDVFDGGKVLRKFLREKFEVEEKLCLGLSFDRIMTN